MDSPDGDPFELDEATAVLSRTPGVLRALFDGLPRGWLDTTERPGAWTPLQVLGHLVEAERQLWIPRARAILEQGEASAFPPFERDAHLTRHRDAQPGELLDLFEGLRRESLAVLGSLCPTGDLLARRGRHPEFGPVTLSQLLATWVVHDLAHSRQAFRAMAKRYRAAVGPWRSYLPVFEE